MTLDPDGFPLDPDPLHVDEDHDHRVSRWDHHSRPPRRDGVPGPALVLAIVGIPLLVLIAAVWLATPRSGPDPTTPQPGASGAIDLRDASAPVQAGTSGGSQSGAPR